MKRPTASYVTTLLAAQLEVAEEHVVPTALLYRDLRALPLALVRASIALEDAFGIAIPDDDLAYVATVEDFMALVARHSRQLRSPACSAPGWRPTSRSTTTSSGGRVRGRLPRRMRRGRWA
jgi:acyl carrier protein